MDKKENLFERVFKKIENFARIIFKRQTNELTPYTEEDFDKDLDNVLEESNAAREALEYIGIMKYSQYTPELEKYIIKSLQNKSCDVKKADMDGDTLLHMAVQQKGGEELVVALLNNGAAITTKNKMGYTPVALAYSDTMRNGILEFERKKSEQSQTVRAYIKRAIEEESFIPISDQDLEQKFPTPVIRVQDITPQPVKNYGKTLLDSIQPYLDEDIQDNDIYIPGQVQKITDQKQLPTQGTSRGANSEITSDNLTITFPTRISHQNSNVKPKDEGRCARTE